MFQPRIVKGLSRTHCFPKPGGLAWLEFVVTHIANNRQAKSR